jgi:hypothetical protein
MSKVDEIVEWLNSTCDDPEGHTCESCFQNGDPDNPQCEFRPLADKVKRRWA